MAKTWKGPIAVTGQLTGDRRQLRDGGVSKRDTPLALLYQPVTSGAGHAGSIVVGVIDHVNLATNPIGAHGRWLDPAEEPAVIPAMAKVRMGVVGPSVDLDNFRAGFALHDDGGQYMDIEQGRISAATLVAMPAFAGLRLEMGDDTDDMPALTASIWELGWSFAVNTNDWQGLSIAPRDATFDADDALLRIYEWSADSGGSPQPAKLGQAFLWRDASTDPADIRSYRLPVGDIIDGKLTIIYHAIYAGAALINGAHGGLPGIPTAEKAKLVPVINRLYEKMGEAFGQRLEPPWGQGKTTKDLTVMTGPLEDGNAPDGLVAGGGPLAPRRTAFGDPHLERLSPIRIEGDTVFGHLAQWDTCHTGIGNVCVIAPRSKMEYSAFHSGTVICDDEQPIRVGKITLGGGHADRALGVQPAIEHYDNSCTAVAVVRAGEDEFGIWVAGTLLPGVSDAKKAELLRSPLSGDWRRIGDNLELIAALAVNTPGFPIIEVRDGIQASLIAAGMVLASGEPVVEEPVIVVSSTDAAAAVARREAFAALAAADQVRRGDALAALKGE